MRVKFTSALIVTAALGPGSVTLQDATVCMLAAGFKPDRFKAGG